jgi:hypothetical protein
MNSTEYFAAVSSWKAAYAQLTIDTRKLKQDLREANQAYSKLYAAAPRGQYGYVTWSPELSAADSAKNALISKRVQMKATARKMLEDRQALKDEAIAFWAASKTVA